LVETDRSRSAPGRPQALAAYAAKWHGRDRTQKQWKLYYVPAKRNCGSHGGRAGPNAHQRRGRVSRIVQR
jgi:hypothetical protein